MWWMIFMILIVAVPLLGMVAYEDWRNKKIDKYNEEQRQRLQAPTTASV